MENQLRCPKCEKTEVNSQPLASIIKLFLGVALILISVFLGIAAFRTLSSRVVKPSPGMFVVAFLALSSGFGMIISYLATLRRGLLKCRCRACNFQWKQAGLTDGTIGTPDRDAVLDMIRACFKVEEDLQLRVETAQTLAKLRDTESIQTMIGMLKEKFKDPSVVKPRVAKALGKMGDPAVAPLVEGLADRSLSLEARSYFAAALAKIGDERMIEPLLGLIKATPRTSPDRRRMLDALARSGDRRAVPVLIESHIEYPAGREHLKKITGQDFGRDWKQWDRWWRDQSG